MTWSVKRVDCDVSWSYDSGTAFLAGLDEIGTAMQTNNSKWGYAIYTFDTTRHIMILTWFDDSDTVIGVNQGTKTFTIDNDHTTDISASDIIEIRGSTGNDGLYTVSSVSLNGSDTDVTVVELISDSTADGTMHFSPGAQIAFGASVKYGDRFSIAANNYGDVNIEEENFSVAWKPTSTAASGFWSEVTNTDNPKDVTTWCSDVDSYRFYGVTGTQSIQDEWRIFIINDDSSPNTIFVWCTAGSLPSGTAYNAMYCIDDYAGADNFRWLDDATDTETSFAMVTSGGGNNGSWNGEDDVSFRDSSGNILEGGSLRTVEDINMFNNMNYDDPVVFESAMLLRAVDDNWTQGRKGAISEKLYPNYYYWRVPPNTLIQEGTDYYLSVNAGRLFPWNNTFGPIV